MTHSTDSFFLRGATTALQPPFADPDAVADYLRELFERVEALEQDIRDMKDEIRGDAA